MQIRDYVRTKRRWLVPLIVVPVVAAAVAGWMIAAQPTKTVAQVQARVPTAVSNSDSQIGLYIARFNEGLSLNAVRTQIVRESDLGRDELRSLRVARRGQSDQFVVTLTTTARPGVARTAAESATKIGSVWVANQEARNSAESVEFATKQYDEARNALFAYQDEIGELDPSATYTQVSRLLEAGSGDSAALQARQDALVPQVRRFNDLKAVVAAANGTLGAARAAQGKDLVQIAAAQSGQQIVESSIRQRSALRPILEGAGVAAVIAFLVVLGLSLLPDLFRRQRAGRPQEPATASAEAASAAEPVASPAPQPVDPGETNGAGTGKHAVRPHAVHLPGGFLTGRDEVTPERTLRERPT